jgi:hypothetical protein
VTQEARQDAMAVSVSERYDSPVEAGAPKDQARLAADAVISRHEAEYQLATKADLAATTTTLRGEIGDLRAEMLAMKVEIIKWNVGTILAAVGLTVAIVKLIGA